MPVATWTKEDILGVVDFTFSRTPESYVLAPQMDPLDPPLSQYFQARAEFVDAVDAMGVGEHPLTGGICVYPEVVPALSKLNGRPDLTAFVDYPYSGRLSNVGLFNEMENLLSQVDGIETVLDAESMASGTSRWHERLSEIWNQFDDQGTLKIVLEEASYGQDLAAYRKHAMMLNEWVCGSADPLRVYAVTSTGFGAHGATVQGVSMLREAWKGPIKIVGSPDYSDLEKLLQAAGFAPGSDLFEDEILIGARDLSFANKYD